MRLKFATNRAGCHTNLPSLLGSYHSSAHRASISYVSRKAHDLLVTLCHMSCTATIDVVFALPSWLH
ncbi:hypothetical protein WAI453_005830 [Rhynchosporium graminicola]